jgi:LacI family transcriptional regulator
MATITDIARSLDISTATVSRALNQSRLVAPELLARINEAADKLGYRKRIIRRHSGRAILNIKLVLPHHQEAERSLFYDLAALIEGIQHGFKNCGINLLCETNSPKFEPFPHKKGGDINAFIFAFNRPSASTFRKLKEIGTPYVILNRDIEGIPCVASENALGMEKLAIHLISRRPDLKPAYVSIDGLGQIDGERLNGFAEACARGSVRFDKKTDIRYFDGISAITGGEISSLAGKYNALVCVNDIVGTVVLSELDRLGIPVPSQISVTGFDDSPVRRLSRPLLTTVSMPMHELARIAASRLKTQIISNRPPANSVRVAGSLIIGEST